MTSWAERLGMGVKARVTNRWLGVALFSCRSKVFMPTSHGWGFQSGTLFRVVHLLVFVILGEGGIFGSLGRDADGLGQPSGAFESGFSEFG